MYKQRGKSQTEFSLESELPQRYPHKNDIKQTRSEADLARDKGVVTLQSSHEKNNLLLSIVPLYWLV